MADFANISSQLEWLRAAEWANWHGMMSGELRFESKIIHGAKLDRPKS